MTARSPAVFLTRAAEFAATVLRGESRVAYKACFYCELLFEVDAASPESTMSCPQCGRALEDYEPEGDEVLWDEDEDDDEEDEASQATVALTGGEAAIVSTMAFDGLAGAVRDKLAARGQRARASAEVPSAARAPAAAAPSPAARPVAAPAAVAARPVPVALPAAAPVAAPSGEPDPAATRMLDAVTDGVARPVALAPTGPNAAASAAIPRAIPGGAAGLDAAFAATDEHVRPSQPVMAATAAIEVDPNALPPLTAPRPDTGGRKSLYGQLGSGAGDVDRSTRVLTDSDLPPPPGGDRPAPRPAARAAPEAPRPVAVPLAAPAAAPQPGPHGPVSEPRPSSDSGRFAGTAAIAAPTPRGLSGARPARRKRSKAPLIISLLVLVLGGGAAGWYFLVHRGKPAKGPETPSAPTEVAFPDRIAKQLEELQVSLPMARGAKSLFEAPYVLGGPEGLTGTMGSVPGLPSSQVQDPVVNADDEGEWIPGLQTALTQKDGEGALGDKSTGMLFALDGVVHTKNLLRMANSARRVGFAAFGLIVGREDAPGQVGVLGFTLRAPGAATPPTGLLVVRVGRLGFHVSVKDASLRDISEGSAMVARRDNGKLDLNGFEERVAALRTAHPGATLAVIHPIGDMPLDDLAAVLARLTAGADGPRFSEVAVSLR